MRALTGSGAAAAIAVGTAVYGSGGWRNASILLAFFVSSTALSRLGRTRKRALVDAGKQGARDGWQVLANGGAAALCALLAQGHYGAWQVAFAGAFAAATADTWATEIGTLYGGTPRSILGGGSLATGLSGGITIAGSLAQVAGALAIAMVAALTRASSGMAAILLAGVAGSLVDSLLGATLQARYYCNGCARACEGDPHVCGANPALRSGLSWLNNDGVNALATTAGAAIAGGLVYFLPNFFSR